MSVKTVDNCLHLLVHISQRELPCGVAELARELALPKANVFRLLASLVQHGFLKQGEDARYEPTLRLWELGAQIVSRTSLTRTARPVLEALAARSGESAQLAVLDGTESIYIDKRDGPHPISGFTRIGTRAPAHCCATGKVELALRQPEGLERLPLRLHTFTGATHRSRRSLADELEHIRAAGHAVNRGEWVEGVWGVAAAIRNQTGGVCASIGVWGPHPRIEGQLPALCRLVREAAQTISIGLGCPAEFLETTHEGSPA